MEPVSAQDSAFKEELHFVRGKQPTNKKDPRPYTKGKQPATVKGRPKKCSTMGKQPAVTEAKKGRPPKSRQLRIASSPSEGQAPSQVHNPREASTQPASKKKKAWVPPEASEFSAW